MKREQFIGEYLDRKMKGHGLPLSMEYYSLLERVTEAAERAWKRKQKKNGK